MTDPSLHRPIDKKWLVIAGIASLLAVGTAVALLDPGMGGRTWTSIDQPDPEGLLGQAGQEVALRGRAARSDGCEVRSGDMVATIQEDRFSGTVTIPEGRGDRLVWFDVICEGEVRERLAREVRPADVEAGRVDVAKVHLDTEALEGLSASIPAIVNPPIAAWLKDEVHKPDSVLRPGAKVVFTSFEVQADGDELFLDMTVDLDLHQAGFPGVHLKSTGQEVVGTIVLDEDGVELRDVAMSGSLCDAYAAVRGVGAVLGGGCDLLQGVLQPRIEEGIERVLNEQADSWAQSVDRRKLVGDAIIDWLENMRITERLAQRFEGASLDVDGGRTADGLLSFTVTADATWLEAPSPQARLELADSESPLDVAVTVALTNRALGIAFDRPMSRVVPDLEALGGALGWQTAVDRIGAQLSELEDPDAAHESGSLGSFLDAVALEYNPEGRLVPKLRVAEDDLLLVHASQARLFRSAYEHEGVELGLTLEGRISVERTGGAPTYRLEGDYLFDHLTIEPLSVDGGSIGEGARVRLAALSRLVREEVSSGASGPGWDALRLFLATAHELPGHFEFGSTTLTVDRLEASAEQQLLVFSGDLSATE